MGKFNFEKFGKGLLIFLGIVVLSGLIFMGATGKFVSQKVYGDELTPNVPNAGTCSLAPSVTTAFVDQMNSGTAVTPTLTYQVKNAEGQLVKTSTAPSYKTTVNILANASGYLTTVVAGKNVDCGANFIDGKMYAYSNATVTMYSDDGLKALVQSTANETVKSAGSTYNWKVHLQGVDKKSTGKMLYIVEVSVPANVSSVTLSGGQAVAVPNGYTRQLTNGYASAFLLPAIVGTTPVDYYLTVQSASGKVVTGQVYTTVFATQPFFETDGSISDNGLAFDSLNTAKYQDTYTKNFIIA